jgi:hypothetical protein
MAFFHNGLVISTQRRHACTCFKTILRPVLAPALIKQRPRPTESDRHLRVELRDEAAPDRDAYRTRGGGGGTGQAAGGGEREGS